MISQPRDLKEGPKQERITNDMKTRNKVLAATLIALAFVVAPDSKAAPSPDGGPVRLAVNEAPQPGGGPTRPPLNEAPRPGGTPVLQNDGHPMITIHSTDNVTRGKIGTFVLNMNPVLMLGGMYVKFSVSGTAIQGVDYVALVSPAYIGQSGYGVIQIQTLADPRGSSIRQAYSVVVTLESGAGYALGQPSSATMWIKP
jgi:hypothetical protein